MQQIIPQAWLVELLKKAKALYPSTIEMQKRVKDICKKTSVLTEEAFCALAFNNGNIQETIEC